MVCDRLLDRRYGRAQPAAVPSAVLLLWLLAGWVLWAMTHRRFRQQTSQAQAILAYLLTTARANTVAFPSIGVNYPWGNPGAPANCKVKSFTVSRVNFVFWDFKIELVEVV